MTPPLARLRRMAFTFLYYGYMLASALVTWPVLRRDGALHYVAWSAAWMDGAMGLMGLKVVVRGRERLPAGACLCAANHSAAWETWSVIRAVARCAIVYKHEIDRTPVYGAWMRRLGHIALDREGGAAAFRDLLQATRQRLAEGRPVVIFPAGTRRPCGAPLAYKAGIALLYARLGQPVVPIVHTSGLFWSPRAWRGHPGTLVVEVLDPIAPGLDRDAFLAELERVTQAALDRLMLEAAATSDPQHWPEPARARLAWLAAQGAAAPLALEAAP